ncbi:hypothetical protein CAOG_01060 [Capsaspora owczarzaki ATCC 30864]|uniref:Uncharacterized protein n=1 Tax=Capsaspora owczarzaki (strain ATCC 30864) TaxID=595528 RepID=A0A0D2X0T6_CAPO3|nr:hypothetical protein CAOG_01060 [Capsaspora owczarzaki ATCC 30864]KJE89624.1 hypothetical protein CAOG_001060 [Capsaspora owczarzaki ATCC 30864]|eukprot:XP_004365931.2 hypothetical protein CAOG_01060 [Capsaspora owczarzaki ATCC 30864]
MAGGTSRALARVLGEIYKHPLKVFRPGLDSTEVLRLRAIHDLRKLHNIANPDHQFTRTQVYSQMWRSESLRSYMHFLIPPILINAMLGSVVFFTYTEARSALDARWLDQIAKAARQADAEPNSALHARLHPYASTPTTKRFDFNLTVGGLHAMQAGALAGAVNAIIANPIDSTHWFYLRRVSAEMSAALAYRNVASATPIHHFAQSSLVSEQSAALDNKAISQPVSHSPSARPLAPTLHARMGLWSSLLEVYRQSGVLGLYSGLTIGLVRGILGYGVFFQVYEQTLTLLQGNIAFRVSRAFQQRNFEELFETLELDTKTSHSSRPHHHYHHHHYMAVILAGSLAGAGYQAVAHPLGALKHETLAHTIAAGRRVTFAAMQIAARQLGWSGMTAGFTSSLYRAVPSSVIGLLIYEALRDDPTAVSSSL